MLDELFLRLVNSLTEPVQIIMMLWILYGIKDKYDLQKINRQLLDVQQERGATLTKITYMIEQLLRGVEGRP